MRQRVLDYEYRQGLLDALNDNVRAHCVFGAFVGDEVSMAYLHGVQVGLRLLLG